MEDLIELCSVIPVDSHPEGIQAIVDRFGIIPCMVKSHSEVIGPEKA